MEEAIEPDAANAVTKVLDTVWNGIVLAEADWSPGKSCFALADEYRRSGRAPEECAANFIDWQAAKATATGLALGLPGLALMPATVPSDLTATAYLQLRMVAVIGLLFDWDVRSDQFRTLAYLSLLGTAGGELLRDFGVQFTSKLAAAQIARLSSKAVLSINRLVGFKLLTKAGSTGLVNLTKIVPVLGGIVGGGVNLVVTRQIGQTALVWLKEGPGTRDLPDEASDPAMTDEAGTPVIGGVPEYQS